MDGMTADAPITDGYPPEVGWMLVTGVFAGLAATAWVHSSSLPDLHHGPRHALGTAILHDPATVEWERIPDVPDGYWVTWPSH